MLQPGHPACFVTLAAVAQANLPIGGEGETGIFEFFPSRTVFEITVLHLFRFAGCAPADRRDWPGRLWRSEFRQLTRFHGCFPSMVGWRVGGTR